LISRHISRRIFFSNSDLIFGSFSLEYTIFIFGEIWKPFCKLCQAKLGFYKNRLLTPLTKNTYLILRNNSTRWNSCPRSRGFWNNSNGDNSTTNSVPWTNIFSTGQSQSYSGSLWNGYTYATIYICSIWTYATNECILNHLFLFILYLYCIYIVFILYLYCTGCIITPCTPPSGCSEQPRKLRFFSFERE
jgi:hypothetical protein